MINRQKGVKKSAFTASGVTPISGSATFDYVQGGQNLKVTLDDLLPQLGTTGSIVQTGNPLGCPVLDDQGAIKAIRNISEGFGIKCLIDAQNGLEISTNFSFDQTGTALVDDPASPTPLFRSISAGAGIAVGTDGSQIQISASVTPSAANVIIIESLSDFPTPVSGVITLADSTVYLIASVLVDITPNVLVVGSNTVIAGENSISNKLITDSASPMITSIGNNVSIVDLSLANPSGLIGFHDGVTPKTGIVIYRGVIVTACTDFLDTANHDVLLMQNVGLFASAGTTAYRMRGVCNITIQDTSLARGWDGVYIDITDSTHTAFDFENTTLFSTDIANIPLVGDPLSGNIEPGGHGAIRAVNVFGQFTPGVDIKPSDLRWDIQISNTLENSVNKGSLAMPTNALPTVFPAINTPVKIAGVWTTKYESRFESDSTGRHTYLGTRPINPQTALAFSIIKAGGGTDSYRIYIAINGVVDTDLVSAITISAATEVGGTVIGIELLDEGDYIEGWIECTTSTNSATVTASGFLVSD
jgi:hypothetical protein